MIKIVADHKIPFLKGALDTKANVVYLPGRKISKADVQDADALIVRTRTCCNASLLEGSKVRFIASATIGYDHIDTAYCDAKGIRWTNAPGCNAASVVQYMASVISHIMQKENFAFGDVKLGIIGCGNVGFRLKVLAESLGMQVWVNDPPRQRNDDSIKFSNLDTILHHCNIISLHIPLQKSGPFTTLGMASREFFSKMQNQAWFVNTSRGEVMQSEALKEALQQKTIRGCILDVWENEPQVDPKLLSLVELGTSHIAGYSADGKAMGTAMSVQAISAFFGLKMDDWHPSTIPQPPNPEINIPAHMNTPEAIFHYLCNTTYDIAQDSAVLKNETHRFECFREGYPLRREWPAYTIKPAHNYHHVFLAEKMGFRLKTKGRKESDL